MMRRLTLNSPSGRLTVTTTARDMLGLLTARTNRWAREAARSLPSWLNERPAIETAETQEISA